MAKETEWDRIIKLHPDPKGYCEIMDDVSQIVLHGPVVGVSIDVIGYVHIKVKWVAQMPQMGQLGFGKWVSSNSTSEFVLSGTAPVVLEETGKGPRVRFGLNFYYVDPQEEANARILAQAYPNGLQ